jgi:hypothetical protein
MLSKTDEFIQKTTLFLEFRDKEAGAGKAGKFLGATLRGGSKQLRKAPKGIPGYGGHVPDKRIAKSIDDAASKANANIDARVKKIRDAIDQRHAAPKVEAPKVEAPKVEAPKAEAPKPNSDEWWEARRQAALKEDALGSSGSKASTKREALKRLKREAKLHRHQPGAVHDPKTGKLDPAYAAEFQKRVAGVKADPAKDIKAKAGEFDAPGLSRETLDAAANKALGNTGFINNTRRVINKHPVKTLATIAATGGVVPVGKDLLENDSTTQMINEAGTNWTTESIDKEEEDVIGKENRDAEKKKKTDSSDWMDKLSTKGSELFKGIQDFANTSTGAATIGGTTGAGLAYIADKLLTKDSEEDDTQGRRLLLTLVGGVLGAGAGYGIQKIAAEEGDVRAMLRQEASALSDEELEAKVSQMELMEKQASYGNWISDRLKLHFNTRAA